MSYLLQEFEVIYIFHIFVGNGTMLDFASKYCILRYTIFFYGFFYIKTSTSISAFISHFLTRNENQKKIRGKKLTNIFRFNLTSLFSFHSLDQLNRYEKIFDDFAIVSIKSYEVVCIFEWSFYRFLLDFLPIGEFNQFNQ